MTVRSSAATALGSVNKAARAGVGRSSGGGRRRVYTRGGPARPQVKLSRVESVECQDVHITLSCVPAEGLHELREHFVSLDHRGAATAQVRAVESRGAR